MTTNFAHMDSKTYKLLREKIGTQQFVASLLDLSSATIARREQGVFRVKPEAALALKKLYEIQQEVPSVRVTRLKPQYGPGRKR